jgi:hypothetical protein
MWTYFLGPFLSLLPKRWRKWLISTEPLNWERAAFLSGLAEFGAAIYALMNWYSYFMNLWVQRGAEVAINGGAGSDITDHAIGAAALLLWTNHPLTWILGYLCVEGAVRLCGAVFADTVLGTLPLFLVDKVIVTVFGMEKRKAGNERDVPAGSFAGAIREKMFTATLPKVPDELSFRNDKGEQILEISACRPKEDWTPPRVVRFKDNYYRLEGCSQGVGRRPFRYTLRRLAAGVPGRSVLLYSAE